MITAPVGGLGNRLISLFATIAYAVLESYDEIIIKWAINDHCNISLHKIIRIKNFNHQIIETETYELYQEDTLHIRPKNIKSIGNGFVWEPKSLEPSQLTLSNLEIFQWIAQNIHNYIEFVPYEPIMAADIGLHCRRSDWGATMDGINMTENLSHKRTLLDIEFEKYVKPLICNKTTFLSTDSAKTEEYFKLRHPHIVTTSKTAYPTSTNRNKLITLESLIDLHTLAASQTIIRDSTSTFSLIAALINGKLDKLITWPRPFLQISGPGF